MTLGVAQQTIALPSIAVLRRKRQFDICCASLGILILSPLLLVVAIAVKISSPGGAFFLQERIGMNGKPFMIYKFRTMRRENNGLRITTSEDCRITTIGRFLRKLKIDELPQLFNVLKGDMSFVGPRPEVKEYTELYTEEQRQIFLVRPGITGLASIYYRNESDILSMSSDPNWTYIHKIMPEKLQLDMIYIPKASVCYDIQLILKTFVAIVKC